jgi:hypothetical protein
MAAVREPDRHIFLIVFMADILEQAIVEKGQSAWRGR